MIFTTGLLLYHTNLIKNNMTTKEELKNVYKNPFGNPFGYSLKMNIKRVLFPGLSVPSLQEKMHLEYHKTKAQSVKIKPVKL